MFGDTKLRFDKTEGIFVEMNEDEFFMKIKNVAVRRLEKNRPVFVFFRDRERMERYLNSSHLPVLDKDAV